ncbi:uncharacterized protein V6R79_000406 [Siganus canaliculatus]
MRWLLAGCCGLALLSLSVALHLSQNPRFYSVKVDRSVTMHCLPSTPHRAVNVEWYKVKKYDDDRDTAQLITAGERFKTSNRNKTRNGILHIANLHSEDSGLYLCKAENTWGPGTELHVARHMNISQGLYRTQMKDVLIVLQGLLLAVVIAAAVLRTHKLSEKKDVIYEEPETDHIYEGLAIETCGGGLYEELTPYAQPEGAEAPWE